jgi:hypothetical protein
VQVDKRCEALDERIKKLDAELIRYRQQMQRTRPGPAQNGIKQRALKVMKQKKMYVSASSFVLRARAASVMHGQSCTARAAGWRRVRAELPINIFYL